MAKINAIDIDIETGGGNTYTFPSATSTLATLSLAETLTNKDLSAASNTLGSANVTAAGALMDSEVTNLADVKAFDSTDYVTPTGTETLTNKRTTARVWTAASDATPDVDSDSYDAVTITALAVAITDVNVTGTPTNFQKLIFRILDNGTARAIAWGTDFQAMGVDLPTTTTISKVLTVGFIYDTVDSKWGCVAVANET